MKKKGIVIGIIIFLIIIMGIILGVFLLNKEYLESIDLPQAGASKMKIVINDMEFTASFYDNDAVDELMPLLPLTLNMKDLNSNEKYYYFDRAFSTNPKRAGKIEAGDIMLFSNDCFVIFYETFLSNYSYTKIAKIDNPTGLKKAVGSDDVTVTLKLSEDGE